MTARIFIDGKYGTTGLEVFARLKNRDDLELIEIEARHRKSPEARAECLNRADLAILCLPDKAAIQTVQMIKNPDLKLIDASSAHRIAEGWVYGFAECAPGQRSLIAGSRFISNPGCYAMGAIALLAPLVRTGLIPPDFPVTINAVSGYSGGGSSMIAEFEDEDTPDAFRIYGLGLDHKHVPEITRHAHLHHRPIFVPSVGNFHRGMLVNIPLNTRSLPDSPQAEDIRAALADAYLDESLLHVASADAEPLHLKPEMAHPSDHMELFVFGSKHRILMVAQLDNLGKGAAGAAIQNLNLALGLPETAGLFGARHELSS